MDNQAIKPKRLIFNVKAKKPTGFWVYPPMLINEIQVNWYPD
jgi:hypothetical protein